jgi:hypothetical protein
MKPTLYLLATAFDLFGLLVLTAPASRIEQSGEQA